MPRRSSSCEGAGTRSIFGGTRSGSSRAASCCCRPRGDDADVAPVIIERVIGPPAGVFDTLLAESEREGSRFVRRIVDEWAAGTNRFDRPGEALFTARLGDRRIGVCGLNVDP